MSTGSTENTVFLVYNEAGDEQFGLTVGNDIVLLYADTLEEHNNKVKFNTRVNDGRWVKNDKIFVITSRFNNIYTYYRHLCNIYLFDNFTKIYLCRQHYLRRNNSNENINKYCYHYLKKYCISIRQCQHLILIK